MLVFDSVLIFTPDVGCPFILLNVKEMSVCSSYETFIKRLFCEILARDSHLLCYIIRHNFLKSVNTTFYEPCDIWIVFNLIHQP